MKGNNSLTEHYSAIKAEVTRPDDNNTQINYSLIQALRRHTKVIVCGQALSHCVNFTVRDLVKDWGQHSTAKLVLAKDASSAVTHAERAGQQFLTFCRQTGVQTLTADEIVNGKHLAKATDLHEVNSGKLMRAMV